MIKKYVEQPAFETNEFKAGDNVRIYIPRSNSPLIKKSGVEDTEVMMIDGDYLLLKLTNHFTDDVKAHFKACRLLKEVKPREFWLDFDNNTFYEHPHGSKFSVRLSLIKVREVLEGDE